MAIIRKEAYFKSSDGIHSIRTLIWSDDEKNPRAVFQIAHGASEHIGRYDDFARFLAANGFVVCGNDHLGHGKSVSSVKELGFFAEEDGDMRLVDDMHILRNIMHKRYPQLPYILFGHSMGSMCARIYTATFGSELSGAIYCGTAQVPAELNILEDAVASLVKKFGPHTVNTKLADSLNMFSSLMVEGAETNLDWLSKDEENRLTYANDPLCGNPLSLGGMRDLMQLALKSCRHEWAECLPEGLPIMFISGAKDPIGLNGKGVLQAADSVQQTGNEPTVILYPGDRHEILNEEDNFKVYSDILKWLNLVLEK